MIARIRSALLSINASYWFYPALFSAIAFFLSFFTIYLDRNGAADWFTTYEWLHVSRPNGARTTLTVIAGSMIGVASTVFSITIAAVAYASGNYGPRLLTNFMEDKGNQLSLATFIGTFVYALMIIRVVRDEDERAASAIDASASVLPGFTPQLSLLVAMVLAIFAVAVLVYFLHHIPASIRINTVLKDIGKRLIRDIKDRYPSEIEEREPREQAQGEPIIATGKGYIDIIDFDTLDEVAREHEATIAIKVRTGDFIHPNVTIVELSGIEADDKISAKIADCFSVSGMRTATQDLEYLIDELVEIALRALSPGINDPFTAITAMHWMGAALAELGSRDLDRGPEQEDYDWDRVQPLSDDFSHYVERSFGAMRSGVATNRMAAIKFIHALFAASTSCRSERRLRLISEEAETMVRQARYHLVGPSMEELEASLVEFNKVMDNSSNALLA
ncbi:DUF2254 domain-containing protein [Parasphingorhabdus flavimaris]|jgi:uncharacterized membrane protein|uniref:DUF2254 domain-containing protein n=1 Tax=Parasphingorhabdus flavimaris TaxID=266812 RepID=A0ABX2MY91_9SPHN|nr:DUF2254 domain-containing protein [Parasphingorhabdus flavimaris]NVD26405.1 DUF2254 domain-containing protein [Parasphingorhabdus flavimaris]|tara:strand:+ start:1500 stop:2843 length:1344 start_codon:yes stop_codon:yes gene_type:complete